MSAPPPVPARDYKLHELVSKFKSLATGSNSRSGDQGFQTTSYNNAASSEKFMNYEEDAFKVSISRDPPLGIFSQTRHPTQLPSTINNLNKPVGTNKFYGNMLLEQQTLPVWTHPYSVWFSKDESYTGLAVSHAQASMRVTGPDNTQNPVQFFFSPNGIKSVVLSAMEFTTSNVSLGLQNIKHLSTDIKVQTSQGFIQSPLVQGMGFITGVYNNLTPVLSSIVGFASLNSDGLIRDGIKKYKIVLNNQVSWVLYISLPHGQQLNLEIQDSNHIVASNVVHGAVFQLATTDSPVYDQAAGAFVIGASLSGSVSGTSGKYSVIFDIAGASNSGSPLVFALPHHVSTFDRSMDPFRTDLILDTTVYGRATGYLARRFDFDLIVPSDIRFDPYLSIPGARLSYSSQVLSKIKQAAAAEADADVAAESNIDSMYTSGKILAKYAWLLYITHTVLQDHCLTNKLLPKVKIAIERFSQNKQKYPLSFDTTWKGLLSTADGAADFGNSFYNDHHFHYGYHIIAAALTAKVDRELNGDAWLNSVKDWVNNLLRDVATPNEDDPFFPAFRSFDWFGGHSWAKGIYPSGDGKDEESSSEDYNFAYAAKLWAIVTGDSKLEERSNIMLGVLRASINHYMLMDDDNKTQPSSFIKNKVSGIMFENKIDHTTYFGNNIEYIQMIHAIPITPISSFMRTPKFVKEEWEQILKPIANKVTDGWKGIIYLNLALYDPKSSYDFFSSSSFTPQYLDNGQSKAWSLTYSGAFASL